MAIVRKLERVNLERDSRHTEVSATYTIVEMQDGKYLQIDTYGSSNRAFQGKKSQSMRLSPEAIAELKKIIKLNNL